MVWSVFALVDGVFFTDPFPGYAALKWRVRKAHEDYIHRKSELIDQLRDIRDDAAEQMAEEQSDLGNRRGEQGADDEIVQPDNAVRDVSAALTSCSSRMAPTRRVMASS